MGLVAHNVNKVRMIKGKIPAHARVVCVEAYLLVIQTEGERIKEFSTPCTFGCELLLGCSNSYRLPLIFRLFPQFSAVLKVRQGKEKKY